MKLEPAEQELLDNYREMMGPDAGNLALALDSLTDVMALVNQHKVYCRVEKGPHEGDSPLDLQELSQLLEKTKALVQQSLLSLREA